MKKTIICNQKMYLSYNDAKNLRDKLLEEDFSNVNLIICPGYLNMHLYKDFILGAQDCFYKKEGAFTGEVSAYHLSLIGVKYSLVGHAEKRRRDTEEEINLKLQAVIENGMTPILCVGESALEKEKGLTKDVLKHQIFSALDGISLNVNNEFIIAYEPVWAIGKDVNPSRKELDEVALYIKEVMKPSKIKDLKVLYGGSVNENNIKTIISDNIDGYLLGRASTKIDELKTIIKCTKCVK